MSIDWLYAQITGKFPKPPAYANRTYHVYNEESENITALVLGPNYIPEPITPLNPNNVKMIIYADSRGINDEFFIPLMDNYTKKIREIIPNAKFIKIVDWSAYYHRKYIITDPPGYENYWDKYVIPCTKFYDYRSNKWLLDFPSIILIMKNGSYKTYSGLDSYKDYFEVVRSTGYRDNLIAHPPIDKLFLDIKAYYEKKKDTAKVEMINKVIKELKEIKEIIKENYDKQHP